MFRLARILGVCIVALAWPAASALAQPLGATTGAIDGTLTDATGAVLPGVIITASGEALMVPRSTTSGADGSYRFAALPPGIYSLSFARQGFRSFLRDTVRVMVGSTVTLSASLETAGFGEVVTVPGGIGAVDRRSTRIATDFDASELERLPGSRTVGALLNVTPAVQLTRFDVGGSTAFGVGIFGVYGTFGFNRPTIEGIAVTNMNPLGFALDYGSFASVSVGTGAYGPEWATPGLHMQFITKSGGDRYSGSFYGAYQHGDWQAHNIDAAQIARGAPLAPGLSAIEANRLRSYRDVNADAGGYLAKGRLWWYASVRNQASSARQVNFPIAPIEPRVTTATGKGTWRISASQQAVLFAQGSHNRQPIRLEGFLRGAGAINAAVDSTTSQDADGIVWKAEWSAVVGTRLILELRAGAFNAERAEHPNGSSPRREDLLNPEVSGANRDWREEWRSSQMNGAASYFRDGWLGRHQFKAGFQVDRTIGAEVWLRGYGGDVLHVTQLGIPREVYFFQTPSRSESGHWWYALHGGDTWQVDNRLTVTAGARFDRFRVFLPAQHHPTGRFNPRTFSFAPVDSVGEWNIFSPRLGASYDLRGDGRTILKSGYRRYFLPPGPDLGFAANPNARVWWDRFKWADTNGDALWQPGEEFDWLERRGGEVIESIDPDLDLPFVHEITARVEREAIAGLVVAAGVVWRGERQQGSRVRANWPTEAFDVPLQLHDPGPDGANGTGDDGGSLEVFELRPALLGQSQIVLRNLPHADSDYLTWEVVVRKRLDRRWSLLGSFAHTWNDDQAREFLGQAVRANEYPLTPNDFINTDERGRHQYRTWSGRLHATWEGPWELRFTPLLRHQAGQPFARTVVARLNYGTIPVLTEPVGTRRQPNVTILDLRTDKDIRLRSRQRLTVFAEVFNVLNTNPEQNLIWQSGGAFMRPLVIVPPRILRIGVGVHW